MFLTAIKDATFLLLRHHGVLYVLHYQQLQELFIPAGHLDNTNPRYSYTHPAVSVLSHPTPVPCRSNRSTTPLSSINSAKSISMPSPKLKVADHSFESCDTKVNKPSPDFKAIAFCGSLFTASVMKAPITPPSHSNIFHIS